MLSNLQRTMQVRYSTTYFDLVFFHAIHHFLSPVAQLVQVAAALTGFWFMASEGYLRSGIIVGIALYVGLWLGQLLFNAIYLYSTHNDRIYAERTLTVQDDGLVEESRFNKSIHYWPGVVRAVRRPGFTAIYLTPHLAHVVPNRAFSSTSERLQFQALIRSKLGHGKTQSNV